MEDQDPGVKTEVKIECGSAEDLALSWYKTQQHLHASDSKDVNMDNNTAGVQSDVQADPTEETQTVFSSPHTDLSLKQEITEETVSVKIGQLPGKQTVASIPADLRLKQEIPEEGFGIEMEPEIMQGLPRVHSNIRVKQEITEEPASFELGRVHEVQDLPRIQTDFRIIKQEISSEETTSDETEQSLEMQGVPKTDFKVEISTDETTSNEMGQASEIQDPPRILTDDRQNEEACIQMKQTSETQVVKQKLNQEISTGCTPSLGQATVTPSPVKLTQIVNSGPPPGTMNTVGILYLVGPTLQTQIGQQPSKGMNLVNLENQLLKQVVVEKRYACQQCNATFTQPNTLKTHMLRHTGQKPHVCGECGAKFRQSGDLTRHKATHSGVKPFACELCDATFKRATSLRMHMSRHTGEKPYACHVCGASYTHPRSLKSHMIKHSEEKPYCEMCEASFAHPASLRRHMRLHEGETPYACQDCDAKFNQLSSLNAHALKHSKAKTSKESSAS